MQQFVTQLQLGKGSSLPKLPTGIVYSIRRPLKHSLKPVFVPIHRIVSFSYCIS
uniref:Uncharacterized protein n=1 Tax=Anopheles atroparvus TaxID=41427 RepID=A0AAG5D9C1_ANOAO